MRDDTRTHAGQGLGVLLLPLLWFNTCILDPNPYAKCHLSSGRKVVGKGSRAWQRRRDES